MTSLGKTLAQNIAIELASRVSPAELEEQRRQAQIQKLAELGTNFFEKAKRYFTEGILAAKPMDSLYRQVGGKGFKEADDYHLDIEGELDWVDRNGGRFWNQGGALPTSMTDPNRFAASWEAFKAWAAENDLEPVWKMGRGGAGGWWYLHIHPAVQASHS